MFTLYVSVHWKGYAATVMDRNPPSHPNSGQDLGEHRTTLGIARSVKKPPGAHYLGKNTGSYLLVFQNRWGTPSTKCEGEDESWHIL
jgi:hypothetical protein